MSRISEMQCVFEIKKKKKKRFIYTSVVVIDREWIKLCSEYAFVFIDINFCTKFKNLILKIVEAIVDCNVYACGIIYIYIYNVFYDVT